MGLTQQQYACITAAIMRIQCLTMQAQSTIEDHAGILMNLCEKETSDYKAARQHWACKIATEMHAELETLSLIAQKAKRDWLPLIEAHKP